MTYNIRPYNGAGKLTFGMDESKIASILGVPNRQLTNRRGESDYQYSELSLRFSKEGTGLVEIGFFPEADVRFNEIAIFSNRTAFQDIVEIDGAPYEYLGFIILLNLGLTMTGFHDNYESQKAVTLFARGRWDDLQKKMVPFSL